MTKHPNEQYIEGNQIHYPPRCKQGREANRDEDNASSDKQSIELKQEKGLDDAKRKTESGPEKRISKTEK